MRITTAERLQLQSVAGTEIMRFASDHALWHRHIHGVDLDPVQVLKCLEMDQHRNTVDFSCRRTGKTAVKELYLLKDNATHRDQEVGIVAPREAQAVVNIAYHTEAIRRSPALKAFVAVKNGRRQMSETGYQFANGSSCQAYGIMANVDGGDLTAASLEEVDDMPRERLFSRFLLMLGANRRLGATTESRNDPQIRITGVYKGADTLSAIVSGGQYHLLPTVNVHLAIAMGIVNREFMARMQQQLPPEEYVRQLLCRNVLARNFIWEKHIQCAVQVGVQANLALAEPVPGGRYRKRGPIAFGYDAGGHGEDPHASRHAFVVAEQVGSWLYFPFCKTWPASADDNVVRRDLLAFWRYFRPDPTEPAGFGDAYGVGMLTSLNDDLLAAGLTTIDRRSIDDGASTASAWQNWAFSPIRFSGDVKHLMAQALRAVFHGGVVALPCLDDPMAGATRHGHLLPDSARDDPAADDMRLLTRQLGNIVTHQTRAGYPSYKQSNPAVGDDLFDAAMAAVFRLATRGTDMAPAFIGTSRTTRAALLGLPEGALSP